MPINVAINGFGRIGRDALRAAIDNEDFNFIAVVSTTDDAYTMRHLFKYDSVSGGYKGGDVVAGDKELIINGKKVKLIKATDPKTVDWQGLGVDIVMECSGKYRDREQASVFLEAGVKKVVISAPCKKADATIVMGINEEIYDKDNHHVISNASCTTNCLAPMVKVLLENFGIVKGMMTTVHAYTRDQMLLDSRHKKDLRRARAAALSMIPTTTGAASAVGLVIPEIKGKLNGLAIRVPVADVSIVDLVVESEKETNAEEVNAAFKHASENELKGILQYVDEPLVSADFIGNPYSSIFDSLLTDVMDGNMIKIMSWYDNEWGYANRLIDLTRLVGEQL
jgi:glyceraldehyde 3-phosphate dehydrogenase